MSESVIPLSVGCSSAALWVVWALCFVGVCEMLAPSGSRCLTDDVKCDDDYHVYCTEY